MKRREFITLVGGTVIAWPLSARAQQPVIGILLGGTPAADAFRVEAIRQGLTESGYVEGQNVAIEYRWAENQYDRLPALAADLVSRQVSVLIAMGNAPVVTARASTTTIPIVFEIGDDPVKLGLVASLARPGGNLTGINFFAAELAAKQFEVLHETLPKGAVIGLLENPTNPNADHVRRELQAASDSLGRTLLIAPRRSKPQAGLTGPWRSGCPIHAAQKSTAVTLWKKWRSFTASTGTRCGSGSSRAYLSVTTGARY